MWDELREWFDSLDADPYTEAVVAALVDTAEDLWASGDREMSHSQWLRVRNDAVARIEAAVRGSEP